MSQPLTIIIPNYNGAQLLAKNLPMAIKAVVNYPGVAEIVVVDDGSIDDSLCVLKESFPQVKVVLHEVNRGFSEAILSGVQAANTELLFLLNSDVELNVGCLDSLVEYFSETNTFSVCPLILNENGVVSRHSWNIRQFKNGNLKPVEWNIEAALSERKARKLPTLYASGGSMMVRKSMFLELGGFHPIFKPFYSEDYDLGLRAWRRGWSSFFEPNVSVVHHSRGSIKENVRRAYVKQTRRRNNYILEWIHLSVLRLLCTVIPLSIVQLIGELILLDGVNLRGFVQALTRIPQVITARREVRATEKLSLPQVLRQVH